jgi:hypothetical protein
VVALHELDPDWIDPENDPLVRRLRDLEWAKVSPEMRARCWERISTRMAELPDTESVDEPVERLRDVAQRYDFSRRQAPCRDVAAQGWSRRPHLRALASRPAGLSRSALAFS